jgi:hypothetical protein
MSAYPYMPGVPAAGHISGGFWHPGQIDGCAKCPHPPHAMVAEYQQVETGVLYRVTGCEPPLGIVYVHRDPEGVMRAETFRGRRLPAVPPDAAEAVTRYLTEGP